MTPAHKTAATINRITINRITQIMLLVKQERLVLKLILHIRQNRQMLECRDKRSQVPSHHNGMLDSILREVSKVVESKRQRERSANPTPRAKVESIQTPRA